MRGEQKKKAGWSRMTYHSIPSETHLGHPTTCQRPSPFISASSNEGGVEDLRVGLFEKGESGLVFSIGLGFLVRFIGDVFGEFGRRGRDGVAGKLSSTSKIEFR